MSNIVLAQLGENIKASSSGQVASSTGSTTAPSFSNSLPNLTVTGNITLDTAPTLANHATTKSYVDGSGTLTNSGYRTFPSGLIIQWGVTGNVVGDQGVVVNFPIAFPTICAAIVPTLRSSNASIDNFPFYISKSLTQATLARGWSGSTTINETNIMEWIAIGY